MPAPVISIRPAYFTTKAEVLAEIARDDLWPVTIHQGAFSAAPLHRHAEAVRIYVLGGALRVEGGPRFPPLWVQSGGRIDFPAGAVHTVLAEAEVVTVVAFASSSATAGLPQLPFEE